MKLKKVTGFVLLFVSMLFLNTGSASMFTIGEEEMPDLIKKSR